MENVSVSQIEIENTYFCETECPKMNGLLRSHLGGSRYFAPNWSRGNKLVEFSRSIDLDALMVSEHMPIASYRPRFMFPVGRTLIEGLSLRQAGELHG